jgi:hypothetical protein
MLSRLFLPLPAAFGARSDGKVVWGGLLTAVPSDSSVLPLSLRREFSSVSSTPAADEAPLQGIGAMMSLDSLVVLAFLTLADSRQQEYRVAHPTGEIVYVYRGQVILGGTVIVFSPLTGSALTSSPIQKVQPWQKPEQRASEEELHAQTLVALREFARLARERARSIESRTRSASVRVRVLGAPVLEAGKSDGARVGTVVDVIDSRANKATQCMVSTVEEDHSEMDCPASVTSGSEGRFVRASGVGVERYQIRKVSITSGKARETLDTAIAADESMLAFSAADSLAAHGLTVLPPADATGQMLMDRALHEFMAAHALAEAEFEKLTLKFPPAEAQIDIVVDGYNSQLLRGGPVKRVRASKAWARASDNLGRSAEGIGVYQAEEITDWQENIAPTADARQAIMLAVQCATDRLIGKESQHCWPDR